MKNKFKYVFPLLLIILTSLHLIFTLKTNSFFSLDDFAVLSYLSSHSNKEMILKFLSQGDIWGFKKIFGYLNFSLLFKFFSINPLAFIINNYLLHTLNIILVFFITKILTKDSLKALFVSVISNGLYLTYFSNIHEYLITLLVLSSIFIYLKFPKKSYLPPIFFVLALLTKEIAFTLPFMLLSLNIFLKRKTNLKPYFIILTIFLLYQFFVGPGKINLDSSHPYATSLSLSIIWTNLKFYLPIWLPILSIISPFILKKPRTLPLFLVSFLSLLPALILVNRQETYYLYLPLIYFSIFLSTQLPKLTLKTSPVYLLIFLMLGGRKILPPLAKQNYPNWQKVSIQNVTKKVEDNTQEKEVDISEIHLERDAKLMLGSNTLNLFVNKETSQKYNFVYNPDTQTVHVSKK